MLNSVLGDLPALIASYGYGLILVMLESLGLPLPGEATLITASIYAGSVMDEPYCNSRRSCQPLATQPPSLSL